MKGCLKSAVGSCLTRKSVAFGEEISEEVYFADEWDRTPTEPARKLTYQDLLELKEIQRSLPRAQQLPDPVSGNSPSYILDHVPIGLLPLLPAPAPRPASPSTSSPSSPRPPACRFPPLRPRQPLPASTAWVPPHMQHLLPKSLPPEPPKPTFSFLPLLESPYPASRSPSPDHSHDPPTPSLTNDSSPLSRASSSSPEPAFLSLADSSPAPAPTTAWHPFPNHTTKLPTPPCTPPRRKNVMILNGIEISLDDDDDDGDHDHDVRGSASTSESSTPPLSIPQFACQPPPSPRRCSMSLKTRPPRNVGFADIASPWAG